MRLLTLLATTVLLAACVHDTDDFNLFVAESGASLTYYVGGEKRGGEDDPWNRINDLFPAESVYTGKSNDEDPWNTISEKFARESVHTGKSGHDDPWDTIGEKFGSDSVHTGNGSKSAEHDDPWNTITDKFGPETVHTGAGNKSDEPDDPWDSIRDGFAQETVHVGKSDHDDPWSQIMSLFPLESVHTDKTNDRYFLGFEKSVAVFVSFSYEVSQADRARVVEIRGNVLKLEFADGVVQYVIDAPASWTEGAQLVTGFLDATSKQDRPFLGVRFWRTVEGSAWGPQSRNLASVPAVLPSEYHASGASLLVSLSVGQKSHDDPWNRISELFPDESTYMGKSVDDPWNTIKTRVSGAGKNSEEHDDPWDTIQDNFSKETTHTGSGKAHDDPWNTINEKFPLESTHTGKRKRRSFRGKPVVEMLFISVGGEKGGEEDPWNRIGELFPTKRSGGVLLKLAEVRGQVGRFNFVSPSGGESLGEQSVFAVGVPADWEPGLVLRGEALLLDTKKMLPLMGAVTWETDPILR